MGSSRRLALRWPRRHGLTGFSLGNPALRGQAFRPVASPVFGACLGVLLPLALSCSGGGQSSGGGLSRVAPAPGIAAQEHEMFGRLNEDRRGQELAPLKYDEQLADIGRSHSADMRDHAFFAHESPNTGSLEDRLNAARYLFLTSRENLAEGPDVQRAQDGLLNSPKHYANIMATDVTHVGIGIVARQGEPTSLLITQVFAKPGEDEGERQALGRIVEQVTLARKGAGLSPVRPLPRLNTLAEKHIEELSVPLRPAALKRVGDMVAKELAGKPIEGVAGVSVGGQLLPQSSEFEMAAALLRPATAHYGLAVRKVPGEGGRPMLLVLLLVGI